MRLNSSGSQIGRVLPVLLLLVLSFIAGRAQTSEAANEIDPGISITVKLNPKTRLEIATGRERSEELASAKWKISVGANYRFGPFRKADQNSSESDGNLFFVVGSAYEYSTTKEADTSKTEHRMMFDGTPRYVFHKSMVATDRNRLELRWINGDFHMRYRNRLMFERSVILKGRTFTPFGAAEAYWDQRYKKFSIFKFTGGLQVPLIRKSTMDIYYERQHCVTCDVPNTNIFGVTLNLNFSLKKQ
jgi:hypothetical protein